MAVSSSRNMSALMVALSCCLVASCAGAALDDRFMPHFMTSTQDGSVATTADSNASAVQLAAAEGASSSATASAASGSAASVAAVNDSPVIVTTNEGGQTIGKKIQITITKQFGLHGGHGGVAAAAHGDAHAAAGGHGQHAQHAGHAAGGHAATHGSAATAPMQLHLNNDGPLVVDNETVADLVQHMLAGNVQNVQAHGQPLALPPGGKPVAVIFSSAMHVVDLGDLRPPTTPAPAVAAHAHATATAHATGHNHTANGGHQHANAALNHTSLLESLMSPLMSLTHFGGHTATHTAAPAAVVVQQQQPMQFVQAPVQMQPMQMQPIMMMMPFPAMQTLQSVPGSSSSFSTIDTSSQLNGMLQGLMAAKQQLLTHPGHDASVAVAPAPAHSGHASAHSGASAHSSAAPAVSSVKVETQPIVVSAAAPAPVVVAPAVAAPIRKVKHFEVNISKTKEVTV